MPTGTGAPGSPLKFADVQRKIGEHLETALKVSEFTITFARLEPDQGVWKVNVQFPEKIGPREWPTTALFSIDAATGDVVEFKKGHTWSF